MTPEELARPWGDRHEDHDVWPLISEPGTIWCRTCQVHFTGLPFDIEGRADRLAEQ